MRGEGWLQFVLDASQLRKLRQALVALNKIGSGLVLNARRERVRMCRLLPSLDDH